MSVLPPPKQSFDCTFLGLEIGFIYAAGASISLGAYAFIYPVIGAFLGFICDQRPTN